MKEIKEELAIIPDENRNVMKELKDMKVEWKMKHDN